MATRAAFSCAHPCSPRRQCQKKSAVPGSGTTPKKGYALPSSSARRNAAHMSTPTCPPGVQAVTFSIRPLTERFSSTTSGFVSHSRRRDSLSHFPFSPPGTTPPIGVVSGLVIGSTAGKSVWPPAGGRNRYTSELANLDGAPLRSPWKLTVRGSCAVS